MLIHELRRKYPGLAKRADAGSALAAVRLHCIECMGGVRSEVEICTAPECPLYPYRRGQSPRKRQMSEEQRAAAAERFAAARARREG